MSVTLDIGHEVDEQMAREDAEYYERYLKQLRERLLVEGLAVDAELRAGSPADEILSFIEQRTPSLLVMSTHGRSGLSRWRYGSVAGRLMREASVPTLLIGPKVLEEHERPIAIKRILVPLDGSALGELALPPAADLAQALGARIAIARGVQWAAQVYPSFDPIRLNRELDDAAAAYLDQVRQRADDVAEAKVLRGPPADALIECVADEHIDLVVMTSHTRSGLPRAVLGSVADRLLQGAAPVLLVRPESAARWSKPSTPLAAVSGPPRGPFCQSCGMPLSKPEDFGTLAQGLRQNDYCHFCFTDGRFTQPDIKLASMIEQAAPLTARATGMSERDARSLVERTLPQLKRWH